MTKKCNCQHCDCDSKEEYSPWKAQIHRDFLETDKLAPTHRIKVGAKVKLGSGETGVVRSKSWTLYRVAIDQLGGKIRSFEDKHIELDE